MDEAFETQKMKDLRRGLALTLFDIPFYWTILLDDNRSGDATVYREYHRNVELAKHKHNIPDDELDTWEKAAPSVFEVLIGIAEHWNYFYDRPKWYFFDLFLKNLDLYIYWGPGLRRYQNEEVRTKIDIWMARQFQPNGKGSPFPLVVNESKLDMRTVSIDRQMSAYGMEYFYY